jgi:hypothetical protein
LLAPQGEREKERKFLSQRQREKRRYYVERGGRDAMAAGASSPLAGEDGR